MDQLCVEEAKNDPAVLRIILHIPPPAAGVFLSTNSLALSPCPNLDSMPFNCFIAFHILDGSQFVNYNICKFPLVENLGF